MKFTAAVLPFVFLCAAGAAFAGPIADAGARAESLQAEGKTVEALAALDQAVDAVWTAAPLAFKRTVLVDSVSGLGTVKERSNREFKPDEKLSVYVEPVGFGYGGAADGSRIGFDTGLTIENATGQVLSEAPDLFKISADAAAGRREFGMTLSFDVPYVRPGDYVARFAVKDQNSTKTGTFEVPFTVAKP